MRGSVNFMWLMLACLALTIALTFVLCLAEMGAAGKAVVTILLAVSALTFALCPTVQELYEKKNRR